MIAMYEGEERFSSSNPCRSCFAKARLAMAKACRIIDDYMVILKTETSVNQTSPQVRRKQGRVKL
jgi:hypothetical protein